MKKKKINRKAPVVRWIFLNSRNSLACLTRLVVSIIAINIGIFRV